MRKGRVIIGIFAGFVAVVLLALALLFLAPNVYRGAIESIASSASGLQIELQDIELDLIPPRVVVAGIEVHNPHVAFDKALLTLERGELTIDSERYFDQAPAWWSLSAVGGIVRFARGADGETVWARPDASDADDNDSQDEEDEQTDEQSPALGFDRLTLADIQVVRIREDQTHVLEIASLELDKDSDERLRVLLDGSFRDEPVEAAGVVALPSSEKARDVDFHARVLGSEIRIDGRVGHDGVVPGKAQVDIKAQSLAQIGLFLDQDLSRYEPLSVNAVLGAPQRNHWTLTASGDIGGRNVKADADVRTEQQRYRAENLALQIDDSNAQGSGVYDAAQQLLQGELNSSYLDSEDLRFFNASSTSLDSTPASARSSADAAKPVSDPTGARSDWNLDVAVQIDRLVVPAYEIESLSAEARNEQQQLRVDARVESIQSRQAESGIGISAPLDIEARLDFAPGAEGKGPLLNADLTSAGFDATLQADLGKTGPLGLMPFALDAELRDLSAVQGLRGGVLQAQLPLEVSMRARRDQSARWIFEPLKLTMEDDVITGRLQVDTNAEPLSVTGEVHATRIDINRVQTTPSPDDADSGTADDEEGAEAASDSATPDDLIGDEPIDWSWLSAVELDLDVKIDTLIFNQTGFKQVRTGALLKGGRLAIEPIAADLDRGGVRGHVYVDQRAPGAAVEIRLVVNELTPADLGRQNQGLIDGGETDLFIDLRARGGSPQQLASALDGEMALEIQRATIRNGLLDMIGSDLVTQTVNLLNPFAERDDKTELECAAVRFKADKGVLSSPDQIVIETSKMKIRGGGEINLTKETLRVDFVPSARSGLGISVADLAKFVRIGGTLANPEPVADPEGILKSGATIGAAIATGGVSLLAQGLFQRARNQGTVCGEIFENNVEVPESIEATDGES